MTFYPYSPIFIDLTFKEYAKLFTKFFTMNDRSKLQTILEDSFLKDKQKEHLFPVLSVRTGFDLFLQAANFPKGSEIIMTGINIPDMSQVVKNHGMIAVPVDVDMDKLAPKLEDIEQRITPNTKAIILSYIFGATFFIEDIVKLAKKHNLYIVEDLAETFMGQDYNGHQDAHVSLFSFGAIKYNTALNGTENAIFDVNGLGGIAIVRNSDELSREMRYILEKYPMQPTSAYFKKCAKLIIPALITNNHTVNKAFRKGGAMISDHYEEFAVALLRGFPVTDGEFLNKFRFQVCTPLLANLAARMIAFNQNEFKEHINKIKFGQDMLLEGGIKVPGHKADIRSFWLFPIVVSDVQKCYRRLNEVGVNAYLGATQLKIVESPPNSKFPSPEKTREFFDKILYLPIQKNVPMTELIKICKDTIRVIQEIENEQMIPTSNVNPRPRL